VACGACRLCESTVEVEQGFAFGLTAWVLSSESSELEYQNPGSSAESGFLRRIRAPPQNPGVFRGTWPLTSPPSSLLVLRLVHITTSHLHHTRGEHSVTEPALPLSEHDSWWALCAKFMNHRLATEDPRP